MKSLAPLAATLFFASAASAETRVLAGLDDARACVALPDGYAVATGGGLALVRNSSTKTLTSLDGLPDSRVHAVATGPEGIWVGTEAGAALITNDKVVRTVTSAPVHAIHNGYAAAWGVGLVRLSDGGVIAGGSKRPTAIATHDGAIHVAFADGPVARIENGKLRPIPRAPSHSQAISSQNNKLLVGDLEGLFRFENNTWSSLSSVDARGLSGEFVATFGAGLLGPGLRAEPGIPKFVNGVSARCAATTEGTFVNEGQGWRKLAMSSLPSTSSRSEIASSLAPSITAP